MRSCIRHVAVGNQHSTAQCWMLRGSEFWKSRSRFRFLKWLCAYCLICIRFAILDNNSVTPWCVWLTLVFVICVADSPMTMATKRTFQPSTIKRKRRHGYLERCYLLLCPCSLSLELTYWMKYMFYFVVAGLTVRRMSDAENQLLEVARWLLAGSPRGERSSQPENQMSDFSASLIYILWFCPYMKKNNGASGFKNLSFLR
jgi:hypothetical protein